MGISKMRLPLTRQPVRQSQKQSQGQGDIVGPAANGRNIGHSEQKAGVNKNSVGHHAAVTANPILLTIYTRLFAVKRWPPVTNRVRIPPHSLNVTLLSCSYLGF